MRWHAHLLFAATVLLYPMLFVTLLGDVSSAAPGYATSLMIATCSVVCLVLGLVAVAGWRWGEWPGSGLLAGGVMTTGFSLMLVGGLGPFESPLAALMTTGAVVLGAGMSLSLLAWADSFSRLETRGAILHLAAAGVCAGCGALLAMGLRPAWTRGLAVALPIAAAWAWRCGRGSLQETPKSSDATRVGAGVEPNGDGAVGIHAPALRTLPWKAFALLVIAGFSSGVASMRGLSLPIPLETALAAVTGALVLATSRLGDGFRLSALLKVSIALYCAGFFLLPMGIVGVSGALISLARWGIVLFAVALLCKASSESRHGSTGLFGFGFALFEFVQLIGHLISGSLLWALGTYEAVTAIVIVTAALLLAGCMAVIWLTENARGWRWTRAAISKTPLDDGGLLTAGGRVEARLREATMQYALTQREREIAGLLLEGKTVGEMAQELFVSPNTVKTHVKHLYGKLDVHGREELRSKLLG